MAVRYVQSVKGSTTATLASTAAGNCLVAWVLSSSGTTSITNWTKISGSQVGAGGAGWLSCFVYPNNPGGVTSVAPTPATIYEVIALEFSGVAPAIATYGTTGATGSVSVTTSNTPFVVGLTGALVASGSYVPAAGDLLNAAWGGIDVTSTVISYVSSSATASGWTPSGGTAGLVATGGGAYRPLGNFYGTYNTGATMAVTPVLKTSSGTDTFDWAGFLLAFPQLPAPAVYGVSPAFGTTPVTVTGGNFVKGQTTVKIGGATAAAVSVASPSSLTCLTAATGSGLATVTVTNPAGGGSLNNSYTFIPPHQMSAAGSGG